jgi:hypothetical protein
MGRGNQLVNNKLIYSCGFKNNIIGDVDKTIEDIILTSLPNNYVFINTTWLENSTELLKVLDKNKTAVCYSGPDWENTNCIDIRKDAHKVIEENSLKVIHVGNSRGRFYFNFWTEFIRQNPNNFLNNEYLKEPDFKKLFMCLNRKPHNHRLFLVDLFEKNNLLNRGYVSIFRNDNSLLLKENLPDITKVTNEAVSDNIIINNDIASLGDLLIWNSYFINVVTETTVHTDVFISEKTWKPIIGMRPFLILGDYHIYNQLKDLGFDTFDDLFGTWYKDPNWENRAKSIVEVIDNYKKEDLKKLYDKIKSRLIKNRIRFIEYADENFKKIIDGKFFKSN